MALWMRCLVQAGLTAAVMLHEQVSWLRWLCVAGGFAGAMGVLRPGEALFHSVTLLPLVLVAACGVFGAWLTGRELLARRRLDSPQSWLNAIAAAGAF